MLTHLIPHGAVHTRWGTISIKRKYSVSSAGKEPACNAGDPSLIPGSGRSPGEGIGYPLQYSWASLVAQLVNNLPAMWETWVRSLGWEDPLETGKATHSNILAWRMPWTVHGGHKESDMTEWVRTLRWKALGKYEDILFIPHLYDVCLPLLVNQQR